MAIIKEDLFVEASPPVLLSARTSPGYGGFAADAANFQLNPSGTVKNIDGSQSFAVGTENPATADYQAQVVGTLNSNAASEQIGVAVRHDGGNFLARDCYVGYMGGDGRCVIGRYDAGVFTELSFATHPDYSANPATYAATQYTPRLRVSGSNPTSITLYVNNTQIAAFSDNSASQKTAAGNGGIYMRSSGGLAVVNSLLVQDLAGSAHNINGTTTVTTSVAASMQYSQPSDVSVSGTLVSATGAVHANVSGISWKWFDTWGSAPTDSGLMSTDGTGAFTVNLPNSIRTPGQTGYLALEKSSQNLIGMYKLAVA